MAEPTTKADDAAASSDEREDDLIDGIATLPRVTSIELRASPKRVEPPREVHGQKANIQFELKPFSPKPRKAMVTMSDLGMGGRARGDTQPARNKRRVAAPSDEPQ